MSNTQLSQAALLLRSLDEAAKSSSTELQVITPAISKFMEMNDKLNDKLVDNISGYKSVIDDNNALINDVINFNVDGSRGKFANNLKAFAINGTWTVYGQQYIKKKVPFVTQEGPLQKIVWTRNTIQKMLDDTFNEEEQSVEFTEEMDDIVKRFERAYLADIVEYIEKYSDDIDFESAWKAARMRLKNLNENPHRYHDIWVHFFTNKDAPSIPKLIDNINEALTYYRRNVTIKNRLTTNNLITNEVIEESSAIRESSVGFLRREGELKLLKIAGEQSGDTEQLAKFEEADKLNVESFSNVTDIKPINAHSEGAGVIFKTDADIAMEILGNDSDSDSDSDSGSESGSDSDDEEEVAQSSPSRKRTRVSIDANAIENAVDAIAESAVSQAESAAKKQNVDLEDGAQQAEVEVV